MNWAGKSPIRFLALDLLCDLGPGHYAPVNLLAEDWRTSPEFISRAFRILNIECPECKIHEADDRFAMGRKTYREMKEILNRVYRERQRERDNE
jgi:hypothetical protein